MGLRSPTSVKRPVVIDGGGGGEGAPTDAHYVVTESDGTLSTEHVISADGDGVAVTPGTGTVTVALADDAAALEALTGTGFPQRTGSSTWQLLSGEALVAEGWLDPDFGDGSDGDLTLSGNLDLTRDLNIRTLDLNGFNIRTAGNILRCWRSKNTPDTACSISFDGAHAINRFGALGAQSVGVCGGGGAGATGGNGAANGSNATNTSPSWVAEDSARGVAGVGTGAGGAGGASGGGQTGGTSSATRLGATLGWGGRSHLRGRSPNNTQLLGGSGGGGGGSQASSQGGGGGGGGGVLPFLAGVLEATMASVTIAARGGNGFDGTAGGAGSGGGGGGSGGKVLLGYQHALGDLPTLDVSGGTGGALQGDGSAGADGGDGSAQIWRFGPEAP